MLTSLYNLEPCLCSLLYLIPYICVLCYCFVRLIADLQVLFSPSSNSVSFVSPVGMVSFAAILVLGTIS